MEPEYDTRAEGLPTKVEVDSLGIFFICWSIIWTIIVVAGMTFLWKKRNMPILKLRGLPLAFGGIALLHLYWIAVQLAYIYGPWYPPAVEYWIMSIYLPFGIALFNASNSRFLYVAEMQKRFIGEGSEKPRSRRSMKKQSLTERFRLMDYTSKMLTMVCAGMLVQLLLTIIMFVVSRKFHDSFGVPGTEVTGTPVERLRAGRKGWEWWPSIFWQMIWAWVVAPCILWRARNLHDTLGWRTQTIACCIVSLPAAPLWVIALNVPAMNVVNQYFIPPQWLATSVMFVEIFTIFLPCWEVVKAQNLRQETLDAIARWEDRKNNNGSIDTGESSYASWKIGKGRKKPGSVAYSTNSSILTMEALEHTLKQNPQPLQDFSALKDFSGENIAFLMRVSQWKDKFYPRAAGTQMDARNSEDNKRECFQQALRLYIDFISERSAEFQINISSTDFKNLHNIFEQAACVVYGDAVKADPATPFELGNWRVGSKPGDRNESQTAIACPDTPMSGETILDSIRYWGDIPDAFDGTVFDDSETSIKYLVLTNTWPKYVKARRVSESIDSNEAGM